MIYSERLLYVTRNFVQYGEYSKDSGKAAKVIRKHFPEMSLQEIEADLKRCVLAFEEGIRFVEANKNMYWEKENVDNLKAKELEFASVHGVIPAGLILAMLHEIFDWYHVR